MRRALPLLLAPLLAMPLLAGCDLLAIKAFVPCEAPDDLVAISVGADHACALDSTGGLSCWGADDQGQASGAPTGSFVHVVSGDGYSCALDQLGTPTCWGDAPVPDNPLSNLVELSAGVAHNCAAHDTGGIVCWGDDGAGQVSGTPAGLLDGVTAGSEHSCAIDVVTNLATCWGSDGSHVTDTPNDAPFQTLSAGAVHSCGLTHAGDLRCWGSDQAGETAESSGPFSTLATGLGSTCTLTSADGALSCVGLGGVAAVPTGSFRSVALSLTAGAACAVDAGGSATCWGDAATLLEVP